MDEVELVIRGCVDKWRIERRNAYAIVLSGGMIKNPPSVEKMFPLPYDDETTESYDITDFYNSVTAQWN